jgi:hypothetical protein
LLNQQERFLCIGIISLFAFIGMNKTSVLEKKRMDLYLLYQNMDVELKQSH